MCPTQTRRQLLLGGLSFALSPLAGAATLASAAPAASTPASAAPVRTPTRLVKVPDGRLLAPEFARIVSRGALVVSMLETDTPPFFHNRDGQLAGVDVEIAHELARILKVDVRFNRSAKSFNEVVDVLMRGEADIAISKLSRTLARAQIVRFSTPYLTLKHALALNRVAFAQLSLDKPLPQVMRAFKGSIGVIDKSSFADFATRNFPQAQIRPYATWSDVVRAVSSGEVTAAYRDEFEIKRLLKQVPAASLTLRTVTLTDMEDTLGIAVDPADPTLLAFINQYLDQRPTKLDVGTVLRALDA